MYELRETGIKGHRVLLWAEIGACLSLRQKSFGFREIPSTCRYFFLFHLKLCS